MTEQARAEDGQDDPSHGHIQPIPFDHISDPHKEDPKHRGCDQQEDSELYYRQCMPWNAAVTICGTDRREAGSPMNV